MKRFLRTLLCILIGETAANATDVSFRLTDFALNPSTNRTVWVQPMSVPTATSASVVIDQRIIRVTDTNGEFAISNVAPMLYQCSVQAPPQQTLFKILVTATNLGTVNAHDIMVADGTSTFPAGAVAWSAVVSDNRYARSTNSTASLTSGTTGLSVSGGSGAVLGSGTTLTITNLPQSQILNLVSDLGLKLPSASTNQFVGTNIFILFTNSIYQFALTNGGSGVSVAAGSLVTVSTNGTLATVAAVQQTNGLQLTAFLTPASLTNGFTDRSTVTNIARSITNGLATVTYVQAATNGYTSITTSNANAFARTNDERLLYFGNTGSVYAGVTTNGVNAGSAFSSPGSGSPSEQFGAGAVASGISSTAVGVGAEASGNIGASAFGHTSQATAGNSTAFGQFARANEINATAFGRASLASGVNSTAIGSSSQATNSGSFALGAAALATGVNSLSIGRGASAVHDNSMVFGNSVTSTTENQIIFGDSSQYVLFPGNGTVAGTWTNGQVVLTNLIGDRNPIIIGTTNVIWMEDCGLSYFTNGAPYVWNGNNWSNQYNAAAIIFQNPTYFLRHGGTNFYSSSTPAGSSWSLVNGIAPAPSTGYGSYVRMNGLVFIGRHSDTNLEALIRAATNGLQLTAFLTPPQLTNGFVTAGITNGLATTNYVTSQGYVTATVTNGLATITYASNLVLVTSNGISARITGFNTNDYRPGSGITFSTNTPGIIQINNALAVSGSGIITNGGSGTNNYLKTPYLDTPLIVAPNNQNLYEIFYNRIAGTNNFINGAGTASFNVIAGGATNTTGFDQYANTISGGVKNSFGNQVSWSTIGGGAWNQVASQINGVTIAGGESNLVATSDSSYATIPGGWGNRAARFSFAAGNQAWATNVGSWVWSDPQNLPPLGTTGTNQFLIRASGGVGLNTNNPGTNALRAAGNIDADGFTVHGAGISTLFVPTTNGTATSLTFNKSANLVSNVVRQFYVSDFGARGTNSDDTAAISNAIYFASDAIVNARGASDAGKTEVVFPAGTYKTTYPLIIKASGVKLRGLGGPGQCMITNGNTDLLQVTNGPNDVVIENLYLKGPGALVTTAKAIQANNSGVSTVDNLVIRDVIIEHFYEGIHLENVANSTFNVDVNFCQLGITATNGFIHSMKYDIIGTCNRQYAFLAAGGEHDVTLRDTGNIDTITHMTSTNIIRIVDAPKITLRGGNSEFYGPNFGLGSAAILAVGSGGYNLTCENVSLINFSTNVATGWSLALEDNGSLASEVALVNCNFAISTNINTSYPNVKITHSASQRVRSIGARITGAYYVSGSFVTNLIVQPVPTTVEDNIASLVANPINYGYQQWMFDGATPRLVMILPTGAVQIDGADKASLTANNSLTGTNTFNTTTYIGPATANSLAARFRGGDTAAYGFLDLAFDVYAGSQRGGTLRSAWDGVGNYEGVMVIAPNDPNTDNTPVNVLWVRGDRTVNVDGSMTVSNSFTKSPSFVLTAGPVLTNTSSASPEGAITAVQGSMCTVTINSTNNLWVKTNGTGNTGWLPLK